MTALVTLFDGVTERPTTVWEGAHWTDIRPGAGTGRAGIGRAPGVAPGAGIVALKIFGRGSSSDLLIDALEWVARSRMGLSVPGGPATVDVVNLSVGAPYAWGVLEEEGVVRRVVERGALVVAAAGNAGDHAMALGSPAAAAGAPAVPASFGPGEATLGHLARRDRRGGATARTVPSGSAPTAATRVSN